MQNQRSGRTIWITGASSGIGEALAQRWALPKTRLVLSGRNISELERVAATCRETGAEVLVVPFDLTNQAEISAAAERVLSSIDRLDLLVNNGGVSQRSSVMETSMEVYRRIMETDFWGHVDLTKKVLPFMVERGGGTIVVISSLSGLFGFHQRSGYCAAKHALHGFFETLRLEYHREKIRVTLVCPGFVRTNISYRALKSDGQEHGLLDRNQENGITARRCAAVIDRAVRKGKKQVIMGKKEVIMPYLKRFWPWLFYQLAQKAEKRTEK